MAFEVGGQNGLYNEVAESLELAHLEATQEVVVRVCEEQSPCRRRVVVLKHGPVIVQHSLEKTQKRSY